MYGTKIKIFVDFDGTISKQDVGEELFLKFGDPEFATELIKDWNDGKVAATEGWSALCNSVPFANESEIRSFIELLEVDNYFKEFTEFCKTNGFELTIVSDGFDFYIGTILEKAGLTGIEVSSNRLAISENKLVPSFPNRDEDCYCCANCKRNFVLDKSGDEDFTVYIGDGHSDHCVAEYCDLIFAKNSLLRYCEVNRITYYPYSDFCDVMKRLTELKEKKRFKKRYRAMLKRKEVFARG